MNEGVLKILKSLLFLNAQQQLYPPPQKKKEKKKKKKKRKREMKNSKSTEFGCFEEKCYRMEEMKIFQTPDLEFPKTATSKQIHFEISAPCISYVSSYRLRLISRQVHDFDKRRKMRSDPTTKAD